MTLFHVSKYSVLLSRWIIRNAEQLAGKSVLEIGAGLGLAGILFTNVIDISVSIIFVIVFMYPADVRRRPTRDFV